MGSLGSFFRVCIVNFGIKKKNQSYNFNVYAIVHIYLLLKPYNHIRFKIVLTITLFAPNWVNKIGILIFTLYSFNSSLKVKIIKVYV